MNAELTGRVCLSELKLMQLCPIKDIRNRENCDKTDSIQKASAAERMYCSTYKSQSRSCTSITIKQCLNVVLGLVALSFKQDSGRSWLFPPAGPQLVLSFQPSPVYPKTLWPQQKEICLVPSFQTEIFIWILFFLVSADVVGLGFWKPQTAGPSKAPLKPGS